MIGRSRSVPIHQSLLANLALVIVLLGGAAMGLTFLGSKRTAERLSAVILEKTVNQVALRLRQFFEPAIQDLALMRAWEGSGLLDSDDAPTMNRLLVPLLHATRQISALMVADERGREHIVFHFGDAWRSRQTRRDTWGARSEWLEWSDEHPRPDASSRESDYDPRRRPWYQGAMATFSAGEPPAAGNRVYWTEPYIFYTARAPGMTAALAFRGRDGRARVVGVDVLLTDISSFTTRLRAGEHGQVLVLTAGDRVIGLPADPRYLSLSAQREALLKRPDEIEPPLWGEATRALRARPQGRQGPLRLPGGPDPWWVEASTFSLGPGRRLTIEVMVPESDLQAGAGRLRIAIGLVTLMVLGLGIVHSVRLARRYSRPLEVLVRESERISRGDLGPGSGVTTSIREVHHLADAHERMRESLKTLLRLEGDLQVARRIQQDTLPARLPVVPGFDIDAWNEPADETGGDTYDVIGGSRVPGERGPRLSSDQAERVVLLLADATGHGIGPALSVTEVRAMLRMAVRVGVDLPAIVRHLNAQLCADLTEGRFVTAWVGEIDVGKQTLRSFSCGQGPLLYFHAARLTCEVLETDTVPLGWLEELEVAPRPPMRMEPGDIFVALSDGVVDAEDATGQRFGTEGVVGVIRAGYAGSASEVTAALRQALAAFTGGGPAADDCTVIIVKRDASPS